MTFEVSSSVTLLFDFWNVRGPGGKSNSVHMEPVTFPQLHMIYDVTLNLKCFYERTVYLRLVGPRGGSEKFVFVDECNLDSQQLLQIQTVTKVHRKETSQPIFRCQSLARL